VDISVTFYPEVCHGCFGIEELSFADFLERIPLWSPMSLFGLLLPHPADFLFLWLMRRFKGWLRHLKIKKAKTWPLTQGTVTSATATDRGFDTGWIGQFSYLYKVNGEYYSGTHWQPTKGEVEADNLVRGWKDRPASVRYLPQDPSKSLLLLEEQEPPTSISLDS
jgi:hypothetical protein